VHKSIHLHNNFCCATSTSPMQQHTMFIESHQIMIAVLQQEDVTSSFITLHLQCIVNKHTTEMRHNK